MQKKLWFLICACLLVVGVPVLAQDATEEAPMFSEADLEPWTCPEGFEGQTLSIYNWSTYIAEDTVPNFEELCGVTVVYDVFASNEEMLARLRQGNPGYDLVVPTGYAVELMIQDGLLEPLNYDNLPNVTAYLSPDLRSPVTDPENEYSVPYQWGTIGVGYNREAVGEEITSWEQVWNYDGPVAWLEDSRAMLGLALKILGYDPNTSNPDEIAEARDYLAANGSNVVAIAGDDGQVLLERGDVDIAIEYSGDIFQLINACECDTYAYVIPEEGGNIWVDNLAIPTGAPNKALAEAFIDYVYHPQVSADISNYIVYATPNQAAIDLGLIDEEVLNSPAIYVPEDQRENLFYVGANVEGEQAFNDAWDELKILLGQ